MSKTATTVKDILYDRDEVKLIDRVAEIRKNHPSLKTGEIIRPLVINGIPDDVFSVTIQYDKDDS